MNLLELIKVIFFGIVEGITEWLPISSTGHLILLDEFIKLNVTNEFMEMFRVVIQLGAIMAVIVLYFKKLNPFSLSKDKEEKKNTWILWSKVLVGCLPAAIIGLLFDDKIDAIFYNYVTVVITLILYGIFFILIENKNREKKAKYNSLKDLSYSLAIYIGLFQVLSLIPGTSRSGATILGALILGVSRSVATEYTFFLAIPVMFGASFLKILKFGFSYTSNELIILILGMLVSFIVSLIAIKFLVKYIKKHDFKIFGVYRIILGILVLAYFLLLK